MPSSFPELNFSDQDDFDAARLNSAMEVLDQRLRSLEPFTPSWEAAVNDLRLVGLSRLNDAIYPAYQRIQQLSEMGFLTAESSSERTLVNDQSVTFIIQDEVKKDLFTPTPFVAITREANATDYAIGRLISYERSTGTLMVKILSIYGSPGPFSDWWISATAGSNLAAQAYLTQIEAARVNAFASRTSAAADAVKTAADREQTGSDASTSIAARNAAIAAADRAAVWDPSSYLAKSDNLASLADKSVARSQLDLTIATAAHLRANSADNAVKVAAAWDAAKWVNLGNITGAVTIDCNTGCRFYGTLTGNVTIDVINLKNGQPFEFAPMQDSTGGRTVSWTTKFLWPSAAAPEVSTAPNGHAVIVTGVARWDAAAVLAAGWKVTA